MIQLQMKILELRRKARKREIKTANHRVKVTIATAPKSKVIAFFLVYSSKQARLTDSL